jgi:hypothetical protein
MECPKCESKAIVYDTKKYRYNAGEPITEVRSYACTNLKCQFAFAYKNTFMGERERFDVERFLRQYEKQKAQAAGQSELFDGDNEE